jgi:hypothetical protein
MWEGLVNRGPTARCWLVRFALIETLGASKARFALLPRARVGRGVSDIIMHERAGERLRAAAACAV